MKKYIMLGKFPYDFTDQNTGKHVTGVTCFVSEESPSGGEGYYPKKFSFKPDQITWEPAIMDTCCIIFNEYGKISDFTPC